MHRLINKNILIFDTETTGFPKQKKGFGLGKAGYYHYTDNNKYDSSRIVSIAWSYIEGYHPNKINNSYVYEYIVQPNGYKKITNSHIHGITYTQAIKQGIKLSQIINGEGLGYAIKNCDYIIAHNALFDIHILMNELHRIGYNKSLLKLSELLDADKYVCTGELGKNICKLPLLYGGYKMPKLSELYSHFYKKLPKDLHTASGDVIAILKILKKI